MNQGDVVESFKPEYARKHGCAWFLPSSPTDDLEKSGGWASLGGEPAFQFSRASDLPQDVVWWTNLTKAQSWSLGRWSHFKHGGFLGPDWLALMGEWSQPSDIDQFKISCAHWSEVFARVAEWLSRWSAKKAKKDGQAHPKWSWGDGDLCDVLAERMGWGESKQALHPVLATGYQDIVGMEWPSNALTGKRKIVLSLSRTHHAQQILNSRYPAGAFAEVPLGEIPSDKDARWKWLSEQQLPILVRIDDIHFKAGNEDLAALFWGRRGQKFSGAIMEPVWMPAEEALQMTEWIDAYPSAFLRGQRWERFSDVEDWAKTENPVLGENSIVLGILSEALWRAASTPVRTPTKRIKSGVSPRMIWWRSVDRRLCFQAAKILQENNFSVLSYGEGSCVVGFDAEKTLITDWQNVLSKTRIRIPLPIATELNPEQSYSPSGVEKWLKAQANMELFLMIDRLLLPWSGPEKSSLRPILELAMRTLASVQPPSMEWGNTWKNDLKEETKKGVQALTS